MRYVDNLNEFSVTDLLAFKKWFAGSKVVDENGQPLRMYRGTRETESHEHSNILNFSILNGKQVNSAIENN